MLFETAAPILGVPVSDLEAADHQIRVKALPQHKLAIREVASRALIREGTPPIGVGSFNPPTVAMDPDTGQGKPFAAYVYATQIAEVVVDDETGEVEVIRICAAHDCGTAVNPALLVEGENLLAVEVHQGNATSTDLSFDLDLSGTKQIITVSQNAPATTAAVALAMSPMNRSTPKAHPPRSSESASATPHVQRHARW